MVEIIGPPKPQRSMMIKGLSPALPERGKIKIGVKGNMVTSKSGNEFQPPKKLDHFVVTTLERDQTGNFCRDAQVHQMFGEKPTEIPVRLLYDDPSLNFPTRYACYVGRTLWCSGDGEQASRLGSDNKTYIPVQCPCPRKDYGYEGNDKCKINGVLSVLIDGAGGLGGVWKFRTTSYNSVVGILSSMAFLRSVTGGPLAGIPLKLTLRPKQVADPKGKSQTVYVVGLEFNGNVSQLQQIGHQVALDRATTHLSIERIEDEARLLLAAPDNAPLPGDDANDVIEEYYPDQVRAAPPRPKREDFIEHAAQGSPDNAGSQPTSPPQDSAKTEDSAPQKYAIVDAFGEVREFEGVAATCKALCSILKAAADSGNRGNFDGIWESNALFLEQLAGVDPAAHATMVEFCGKQVAKLTVPDDPLPDFGERVPDLGEDDDPLAIPPFLDRRGK